MNIMENDLALDFIMKAAKAKKELTLNLYEPIKIRFEALPGLYVKCYNVETGKRVFLNELTFKEVAERIEEYAEWKAKQL